MNVNEETPEVSTDEPDDLRTDLESAFDDAAAPAADSGSSEGESKSEASESSGQPRRPDGKFAKKVAEDSGHGASDSEAGAKPVGAATTAPTGQPVTVQEISPVQEPIKPPASWKPAAREHWATLPPAVQAEIARREGDTTRVLNETTEARKFRETFQAAVTPYEAMLRSEGSDPIQAVSSLLETARQLKSGSPQQKAAMVAQIVKGYGVPIEVLDAALAGQPYQGQQAPHDPRVDQLFAQIEQAKQQRVQQEAQAADDAVTAFGASKEFFDDVRDDMADIIEMSERKGKKLDLDTAYNRALRMNDEIVAVMRQREEAKSVANGKASTQRAKSAASSIRSSGPPPKGGAPGASLRDTLAEAWEDASS